MSKSNTPWLKCDKGRCGFRLLYFPQLHLLNSRLVSLEQVAFGELVLFWNFLVKEDSDSFSIKMVYFLRHFNWSEL